MPRKTTTKVADNIKTTKVAKLPAKTRGKGKNANLKVFKLADVPVHVFCQIAMYLQPVDLLHLARTNKTFRRVLMKRASRNIWQAAMQNATNHPLSTTPDDMSEPAWINLLFGNMCHDCLKKGSFIIYWEPRVRLCPSCRKKEERTFPPGTEQTLTEHFGVDFEDSVAKVYVLELMPVLERRPAYSMELEWGFRKHRTSDYESLKQELLQASVEERSAIVRKRKATMTAIRSGFMACICWENNQRSARSDDKQQILETRRKSIIIKLRELGWGPCIDKMTFQERNGFVELRKVSQGGPLTDRSWSSIKEDILDYMRMVQSLQDCPGLRGDSIEGWDGVDPSDLCDFWW